MNVLAVGLDLVDVARIESMLGRYGDRALDRLLLAGEREYCTRQALPARHVAARVAAKEATYKALSQAGTDHVIWWHDVEVISRPNGGPALELHGRGRACADELEVSTSLVSLTHSDTAAAAVVMLLG
ncbi:MAG: holo-ACP synthase [Gemmatimonadota bacterium]|nr:MAG: holo-ACP synthase [Gemmatimonadota bacterium]